MKLKRDPYFHYIAALILAGVVLAFIQPTPAAKPGKIPDVAANTARGQPAKS